MFIPIVIQSLNSSRNLQAGFYDTVYLTYQSTQSDSKALLLEYHMTGREQVCACDLVVIDSRGDVFARDFVFLPSHQWRDSTGLCAENLTALLPAEILGFKLVNSARESNNIEVSHEE